MTKGQFKQKVRLMKKEVNYLIDNRIDKILASGCMDLESHDNDFLLPRAFIYAIGQEIRFQFKPHTKSLMEEAKNMEYFI